MLQPSTENARWPKWLAWTIVIFSALPITLNLCGVSFSSHCTSIDFSNAASMAPGALSSMVHRSLCGSFMHTVLEWSAFCVALFTAILACVHFSMNREDVVTPIVGMALFFSGCMDAFHTLAADRLIQGAADGTNLIPFTWALCRLFNVLIVTVGISIVLIRRKQRHQRSAWFVASTSLLLGSLAYSAIYVCTVSERLPQTMFPGSFFTRPYDVVPLVLYLVAGGTLLLRLHRTIPSYLSYGLLLSLIPNVATQLHMAFGSSALFDNHFNIAHFLKIVSYLVPLIGMILEYRKTYHDVERSVEMASEGNLRLKEEIQERQVIEEELRESELRIRAVLDSAADAIITIDHRGLVESFNPAAERMFGYRGDEVLGKKINMLMPSPYTDEHDGYLWQYLETGETKIIGSGREVVGLRKDGHQFPMELAVSEVIQGGRRTFTGIGRDISERKQFEEELRQNGLRQELSRLLIEEQAASLRVQAEELETRNQALDRSNQELEDFAHVASHDLKEPLRGIHSYSLFLLEDYQDKLDDEGKSKLETLAMLSQRMESLISKLLYYSRVGRTELAIGPTDLNRVVQEVLESVQIRLDEQGVEVRLPEEPFPEVICDAARIGEVFRNLVTNSMKYNDKPEKYLEIGFLSPEELRMAELPGKQNSQHEGLAVFYVRDNGIGIREDQIDSVFRIFKRLHSREKYGGGTGAGLTIAKKIVERHSGSIWVESTFGAGTAFYFSLPQPGTLPTVNAKTAEAALMV